MGWRSRLLCCLFLSLSLAGLARGATRYEEWEISYQSKSPDCVRKLAVTINGQTPGRPDAEPFRYDGEHDVLLNDWCDKSTYEQAAGLASVPLVWVGELQPQLINGRGRFVNRSAMAAGACNATLPECASPVVEPDAEPFTFDSEHDDMLHDYCRKLNYSWHKSAYEQATGLASVPLVWVGELQPLLINGRGMFVNCSIMAARACNASLQECAWPVFAVLPGKTYGFRIARITSLSALNFEIENRNAHLIGYPAPAVPSGSTSSNRPPMGYLQYGAALVVVMLLVEFFATLYLATGRPVADQNPATAGGTIARSAPAPSASGSLPVGGGHAPPPSPTSASSPSSGDPAGTSSNPSGSLSTSPSEGQGQLSYFLLGFLAFGAAVMAGILNAGFERILGGWSTGPKVVYKVSTWLATVFLGLAAVFMVAWYSASSMTRNRKLLSISEFCAKLGVILSINLLVVIFPCRLGRGACVAAIPAVAVITFLVATVRIWGRVIIRILGPRRQTQLAGDTMA